MEIAIKDEYIKLGNLLKFSGVADTGAIAKILILSEEVKVNGEIETRRGKKIKKGDIVSYKDIKITVK